MKTIGAIILIAIILVCAVTFVVVCIKDYKEGTDKKFYQSLPIKDGGRVI